MKELTTTESLNKMANIALDDTKKKILKFVSAHPNSSYYDIALGLKITYALVAYHVNGSAKYPYSLRYFNLVEQIKDNNSNVRLVASKFGKYYLNFVCN